MTTTKQYNSYTDIKCFEDACAVIGQDSTKYPDFSMQQDEAEQDASKAEFEAKTIIKALNWDFTGNQPWKPNWNSTTERKYEIWWNMDSFSLAFVDVNSQFSRAGSRFCFRERAIAMYAAEQFPSTFKRFIL